MTKAGVVLAGCVAMSGCLINPTFSMWESNDQGAPGACLPFAGDGGVGAGEAGGALGFTIAGAHHFAFSPRAANGTQFLSLELDEAGTTCRLSSQADANRRKPSGTQTIAVQLVAAADAGWAGTYTVGSGSTAIGTGTASHVAAACQPFLGVLGDCAVPVRALTGTVTLEAVTPCELSGRFELVDPASDGGAAGAFTSVYCRGID